MHRLVRYEALFRLLEDVHASESIDEIFGRVAAQWEHSANVSCWRMVIANDGHFRVVDGVGGKADVAELRELSAWDDHHWGRQGPSLIRGEQASALPEAPAHLAGAGIVEILVLPFVRAGVCVGLLSVAARQQPFDELDSRFIRLFGAHLADRIVDILLQGQLTEALLDKVTHDALTGLLNRGTVLDRLDTQLALSLRTQQPVSVILIDIDHFKAINDRYGHLAGDDILCEMARRLQLFARSADSVGRYGGEEFLVVLYPCDDEHVASAAERFRRGVAETPFTLAGDVPVEFVMTISLGTATTVAQPEVAPEALLGQADEALHRAKREGRNRVRAGRAAHVVLP